MGRDMEKFDVRTFKQVTAVRVDNSGSKYKVDNSKRTLYRIFKKKSETEWPSVSNTASKALSKLCENDGTNCKKTFVLRETTQGSSFKKLWFYEGTATPKTKAEMNAFVKKNPKMAKMGIIPKRDIEVNLISHTKLNHSNPLKDWK
jgi:hypothetical protein